MTGSGLVSIVTYPARRGLTSDYAANSLIMTKSVYKFSQNFLWSKTKQECIPVGCVPPACCFSKHALLRGVYLPRMLPVRGGVPAWRYLPGGTCPGGCTWPGGYLPSGVYLPGGYTCPGVCTCPGVYLPRYSPREQNYWHMLLKYWLDCMYRSGTVNLKSFVGKVLLRIKWKFELTYMPCNSNFSQNFELEISLN